ncbi:hypothetical protein BGP_5922 [Beggiatoa sp. PS]|nr:hypothetical protein BGP_5922 [Beggiatoa sp. PS]
MKLYKQYSDNELRQVALIILTQHLGHANALRFLSLNQASDVDYMNIRHELFEELSAKEIYNNAAEFWQKRNNMPS